MRCVAMFVVLLCGTAAAAPRTGQSSAGSTGYRDVGPLPGLAGVLFPDVYIPAEETGEGVSASSAVPSLPGAGWALSSVSQLVGGHTLTSALAGMHGAFAALLLEDEHVARAPSGLASSVAPIVTEAQAVAWEDAKARSVKRPRSLAQRYTTSPRLLQQALPCSGVGVSRNTTTELTFQCNSTTIPQIAYDAVKLLQRVAGSSGTGDGLAGLVDATASILSDLGVSLGSLISNSTGITVNVSELFSGSLLQQVEQNLNLTAPNTEVDLGELFQNTADGVPVVNLTDLLSAIPTETLQTLIDDIACGNSTTNTSSCLCPVDYARSTNNSCAVVRPYSCSIQVDIAGLDQCLSSRRSYSAPPYSGLGDGDPPCIFIDPSIAGSVLQVPVNVTCQFADGRGNYPYCNGTRITPAFLASTAAARGLNVSDLPGSPPFFDLGCAEQVFGYARGGPGLSGVGVSLTQAPAPLLLTVWPFNFRVLSDATHVQQVVVPSAAYTGLWRLTPSVPVSALSPEYFPGGRLYVEVSLDAAAPYASPSPSPSPSPMPTAPSRAGPSVATIVTPQVVRVVADVVGYEEPHTHPLNVGLVVGLVVPFCALVAGALYLGLRRRKARADARESAEMREQARLHGIGYSAMAAGRGDEGQGQAQVQGVAAAQFMGAPLDGASASSQAKQRGSAPSKRAVPTGSGSGAFA